MMTNHNDAYKAFVLLFHKLFIWVSQKLYEAGRAHISIIFTHYTDENEKTEIKCIDRANIQWVYNGVFLRDVKTLKYFHTAGK